jgi:hypothetical protein
MSNALVCNADSHLISMLFRLLLLVSACVATDTHNGPRSQFLSLNFNGLFGSLSCCSRTFSSLSTVHSTCLLVIVLSTSIPVDLRYILVLWYSLLLRNPPADSSQIRNFRKLPLQRNMLRLPFRSLAWIIFFDRLLATINQLFGLVRYSCRSSFTS